MTDEIRLIKEDTSRTLDSTMLKAYLETAKTENDDMLKVLRNAEEIDDELKYKEKAIEYGNIISGLYEKEFPQAISLLGSHDDNRIETATKTLAPGLIKMKDAGEEVEQLSLRVKEKYNINLKEEPPTSIPAQ
ncbi:MAG: hypothetical protein JWO03_4058 [Bacteroidetes bacterium]|nr:hypothetical protein [Bacteroidota bacterium]